jgi:hypothetical protein
MSLSLPPNKFFGRDIELFAIKLANKENFSFSKFADGEWAVIKNSPIDNKEFWFDPNHKKDQYKRASLINSFKFRHPNYYVCISCPCCQGIDTFNEMLTVSDQQEDHLTWANLWVNANYLFYLKNILPIYRNRQTVLFCNSNSQVTNLPFEPRAVFGVSYNAWENDKGNATKAVLKAIDNAGKTFNRMVGTR